MLIRLDHIRCNELEQTNYMLVPDNKTHEQIDADIDTAMKEYWQAKEEFNKMNKPPPETRLEDVGDLYTIAQAKLIIKQNKADWNSYYEAKRIADQGFSHYLHKLGYQELWESKIIPSFNVDWGHKHGETIKY